MLGTKEEMNNASHVLRSPEKGMAVKVPKSEMNGGRAPFLDCLKKGGTVC